MKTPNNHPVFVAVLVAVLVGIFAAVNGCITVRQSGAHDFEIVTHGNGNQFNAHTERANSAQEASAEPRLSAVGDEALKTAGKTAAALGSGGLSTIPQAAAKIAEDAKPISP